MSQDVLFEGSIDALSDWVDHEWDADPEGRYDRQVRVVAVKVEPVDPRCAGTLGIRPEWMSPDQYDPCRCELPTGHDGPHECEHTRPPVSTAGDHQNHQETQP